MNVHKCRFLKAYPNWLSENYHPAPPVNSAPTSRRFSESPRSPPTSPRVDSSLLPATSGTQAGGEVGTQHPCQQVRQPPKRRGDSTTTIHASVGRHSPETPACRPGTVTSQDQYYRTMGARPTGQRHLPSGGDRRQCTQFQLRLLVTPQSPPADT